MKWGRLFVVVTVVIVSLSRADAASFSGRVYDDASNAGISGLTVKLIPPRDTKAPELVSATDQDGRFSFRQVADGKHLLEIYYGLTAVYREVVTLDRDVSKEIGLQRVSSRASREVRVAATRNWTDTGLIVRKGESVTFAATGEIRWGTRSDEIVGADGSPTKLRPAFGSYPVKSIGAGGLIGRVGSGEAFRVGSKQTMAMPDSGTLFLGINDNRLDDNTGEFHVIVTRPGP